MILDSLRHIDCYKGLDANLDRALDALAGLKLSELPLGRKELDGQSLYYTVMEAGLRGREEAQLEAHRLYADIQVPISAPEGMGWAQTEDVPAWEPYSPEQDAQLSADTGSMNVFTVNAGSFVVLFPQDAHAPLLRAGGETSVRKLVMKVRLGKA